MVLDNLHRSGWLSSPTIRITEDVLKQGFTAICTQNRVKPTPKLTRRTPYKEDLLPAHCFLKIIRLFLHGLKCLWVSDYKNRIFSVILYTGLCGFSSIGNRTSGSLLQPLFYNLSKFLLCSTVKKRPCFNIQLRYKKASLILVYFKGLSNFSFTE